MATSHNKNRSTELWRQGLERIPDQGDTLDTISKRAEATSLGEMGRHQGAHIYRNEEQSCSVCTDWAGAGGLSSSVEDFPVPASGLSEWGFLLAVVPSVTSRPSVSFSSFFPSFIPS